MSFHDHYLALGIKIVSDPSKEVTLKQINDGYKKIAKKYHPDKNRVDSSDKFEKALKAVELLRDETLRAAYDETYRLKLKEELRLQQQDERTKKMRIDLELREKRQDRDNVLDKLRRETASLTQSTKVAYKTTVDNIKTFSLEEHLIREHQILSKAMNL